MMKSQILCLAVLIGLVAESCCGAEKYALLVGVTKYNHARMNASALKYPEADAKSVATVLKASGYTVDLLLGQQATQKRILASLKTLEKQGTADGVVLIGLFGHGVQYGENAYYGPFDTGAQVVRDSKNKILRDRNGRPLLEPEPESMVSMRSLLDALTVSPAGNKVLLADCCREDPSAARGRNAFGTGLTTADLPDGMAALFACSRNEQAFEHDAWKHGAFTQALLNQIPKIAAKGSVTAGTLAERVFGDVRQMVREKTRGQSRQSVTYINSGIVNLRLRVSYRTVSESLAPKKRESRAETMAVEKTADVSVAVGSSGNKAITNSTGMSFARIPAGTFLMGSPADELGRYDDEGPQHRVKVKSFCIGIHEVTQAVWTTIMGTEPWKGRKSVREGPEIAASYISWNDAIEFCEKLSARDGRKYRLPTEGEWEYACRATSTTRFHYGDDGKVLDAYAWYDGNAASKSEEYAHRVGQKMNNSFGLFDMHGNVSEFCEDLKSDYRAASPNQLMFRRPSRSRIVRGGSWNDTLSNIRSAYRNGISPDEGRSDVGFRVAFSENLINDNSDEPSMKNRQPLKKPTNTTTGSFTNRIGMQLKLIPSGSFLMGSPASEKDRFDNEGPQHRVTLSRAFYMGIHEVTQQQWKSVMGTEPWKGKRSVKEGDTYPATYVSWDDATEFCQKLSAREGRTYRLPTEAEWEYACRAGTKTRFHFGDDESKLGTYAWFENNNADELYAHRVGQKRANGYDLFDMHGNVWEWCQDWYGDYSSTAKNDPEGVSSGSSRVLRGGSWNYLPSNVRSAFRYFYTPDSRNGSVGFRVVCVSG